MRLSRSAGPLLLVSALTLSGCGTDLISPEVDPAELVSAAHTDAQRGTADAYVPLLQRLFRTALDKLGQDNREAAARLSERQRTLAETARRALAASDSAAARQAQATAEGERAAAVVRVMGAPIVERVIASVTGDLATLTARIERAKAAGTSAPRMEAVAQRAERLLGAAREAFRAGRTAAALGLAAQAFDLLANLPR